MLVFGGVNLILWIFFVARPVTMIPPKPIKKRNIKGQSLRQPGKIPACCWMV